MAYSPFTSTAGGMRTTSTLATRPQGPVGGVRRRDEDRGQFYNRMDSRKAGAMAAQGPMPFSGRQANIAAARADGTFDAKRNAFNAANSGSYMDEQGNIGPKAPPLPGTSTAARPFTTAQKFASAPDGQGGYKQVPIPAAGASTAPKTATGPMGPFKPRPKDAPFTSMQPGSRDLYAEQNMAPNMTRTQEATKAPAGSGSIFNRAISATKEGMFGTSPAAVTTRAKTILANKPPASAPMVANAPKPGANTAALDTIKAKNPFASVSVAQAPKAPATQPKPAAAPAITVPPKPKPGWFASKIAANPDGIFGKAADVAGKVSRGVTNAAQSVAPVAANVAANMFNTAIANPATAIRGGIIERGKKSPTGAMAKLSKKLPKARPLTLATASN